MPASDITEWRCERCGASGEVHTDEETVAADVVAGVIAQHTEQRRGDCAATFRTFQMGRVNGRGPVLMRGIVA